MVKMLYCREEDKRDVCMLPADASEFLKEIQFGRTKDEELRLLLVLLVLRDAAEPSCGWAENSLVNCVFISESRIDFRKKRREEKKRRGRQHQESLWRPE